MEIGCLYIFDYFDEKKNFYIYNQLSNFQFEFKTFEFL